jgi:hypothetical protein
MSHGHTHFGKLESPSGTLLWTTRAFESISSLRWLASSPNLSNLDCIELRSLSLVRSVRFHVTSDYTQKVAFQFRLPLHFRLIPRTMQTLTLLQRVHRTPNLLIGLRSSISTKPSRWFSSTTRWREAFKDPDHPSLFYHLCKAPNELSPFRPAFAVSFSAKELNEAYPQSRRIVGWIPAEDPNATDSDKTDVGMQDFKANSEYGWQNYQVTLNSLQMCR